MSWTGTGFDDFVIAALAFEVISVASCSIWMFGCDRNLNRRKFKAFKLIKRSTHESIELSSLSP